LAQALDVFIVRLVLLLVHFQQRPQAFDAMRRISPPSLETMGPGFRKS
jgi:hypothetical protein